ncbi:MAG: DUF2189 domain-containing protein [Alphaproteobacteria bacterium]|nr:MAG: DUF2189 domain-containing protein [Alphaproteobacteria bacterium]
MSSEADKDYGLLSQPSGIEETHDPKLQRRLPIGAAFGWLRAAWGDLVASPGPSLAYGIVVFLISALSVWTMITLRWDYLLLPALAGFMIIGPLLAIGLYEVSRAREEGRKLTLAETMGVRPYSLAQVFFAGLLLCLLLLLWMRAAVLIYALFFGFRNFLGLEHLLPLLVGTPLGWGMIVTGSVVGALFAAFAFATSVFSIPMLVKERTDVLTAVGTSVAMVWNNLPVMIAWGAIALVLFIFSVLTAFLGLIIVFPLLGYGTWHAYRSIR